MATAEPTVLTDSTMSGVPLETIAAQIGGPRIDDLLKRAAERAPDRPALRSPDGDLSYAELDERVTRCAAGLKAAVGSPDEVIAVAGTLDVAFAVAFFGIARSGNVSSVVNPYLTPDRLAHVLGTCAARYAIVSPQMYFRLVEVRHRLPVLEKIILTERAPDMGPEAAALPTLQDLIDGAPSTVDLPGSREEDRERVACLQFTSGTTGAAKAAQLTHFNLAVNAAQTAYAQQLTGSSVLFNYLPTFHLMHLTIAVHAAATLVVWRDEDIPASVDAANRYRATHYYSLPVRLSKLAVDPKLTHLEAPALRAILSGGSTLPPAAAIALSQHFGVPVVQGYGLAETSPSMHLGNLERPKLGSCGPLTPGAQSRIVDVDTGAVLPVGGRGEIQVRGPQLMRGYLGRSLSQDVDADGWFATGDVGYVDDEGYLYVVDRIKDTFKCDNWLVSPTEVERILLRHPAVADCVVLDYPDEFRGAVAYAIVVSNDPLASPADLIEFTNSQVAYYEQLRHVELATSIPRSPTGKVERRALRESVFGVTARR
jgi:long-chain acyl-CoA synthetase